MFDVSPKCVLSGKVPSSISSRMAKSHRGSISAPPRPPERAGNNPWGKDQEQPLNPIFKRLRALQDPGTG